MILQTLREQTRTQHERLEARLDILNIVRSRERYRRLLERMYGFYKPTEDALAAWSAVVWVENGGKVIAERAKTLLLEQDLGNLSAASALPLDSIPVCEKTPRVDSLARALGCLYVLEGATLGGQIISRHLQEAAGIGPDDGGAFFRGYGPDTGRRWKDFGKAITLHAENGVSSEEIVAAAQETFACYEVWIGPAAETPNS